MTTIVEMERDARELARWVEEHAADFAPLDIVSVSGRLDGNSNGDMIIYLTVSLNPPADGSAWGTRAVLKLYEAADRWVYDSGYPVGAHVHLQSRDVAQAG